MALISFTSTPIVLPVSDRVITDTTIKQKATFVSLTHAQDGGQSRASINVLVTLYAADGNDYGPALSGLGISPFNVTLVADNNTIVNAGSDPGAIIAVRTNESDIHWQAKADLHPDPVMFQGDFFEMLREQPIKIGDLIRQHIMQADAMGKFSI